MMRGMTEETAAKLHAEIAAQRGEIERLQAENTALEAQIAQLSADLAAALQQIGKQVPAFVKANRPTPQGEKRPRKKRAA